MTYEEMIDEFEQKYLYQQNFYLEWTGHPPPPPREPTICVEVKDRETAFQLKKPIGLRPQIHPCTSPRVGGKYTLFIYADDAVRIMKELLPRARETFRKTGSVQLNHKINLMQDMIDVWNSQKCA